MSALALNECAALVEYTHAAACFAAATRSHELTVLRDDGQYRHLRFASPDNGFYWFDLVTWPGRLVFTGAMGTFVFATGAAIDPLVAFRYQTGVYPGNWSRWVIAGQDQTRGYSEDVFRRVVADRVAEAADRFPGLREAVDRDVLASDDYNLEYEECAREAVAAFQFTSGQAVFRFEGVDAWDLMDWSWWYLWCCHAILWGIDRYRASQPTRT